MEVLTLQQFLATVDLRNLDCEGSLDATIKPTVKVPTRPPSGKAEPFDGAGTTLRLKTELGRGGMGVVHLAEQGALHRDVAVKTLRDEFLFAESVGRLVREARVTGLVEHPNVVPLYTLQVDGRGAPLMVMKRIEGVSWRALLCDKCDDGPRPAVPANPDGRLAYHLEVLLRVCDALTYAHSRGVLHLDVKPDNVMLGAFREVYLADWGVAVSRKDEHRGLLPHADEIDQILGTPAYMAPEMIDFGSRRISEQTDVYLVGATLHELVTGSPPHTGGSMAEVLYCAWTSKPPVYPASVPEELGRIAARAMRPDPAERFDSAEELRAAVAAFLTHRGSARLVDEARTSLHDLRTELAALGAEHPIPRHAHRRFGEARFALRRAIRDWPENAAAHHELLLAEMLMARTHLVRGETSAALTHLDDAGDAGEPPPELAPELAALREATETERDRRRALASLGADQDIAPGMRLRGLGLMSLSLLSAAPGFALWWLSTFRGYAWGWVELFFFAAVFLVLVLGGATVAWRRLSLTGGARRMTLAVVVIVFVLSIERVLLYLVGVDPPVCLVVDLLLYTLASAVAATIADARAWPIAVSTFAGSLLAVLAPAHILLFMTLAVAIGPAVTGYLWFRSGSA